MRKHAINKLSILTLGIVCCSLLGGIYGVIHDQITFSISNEYFTKFKYQQFNLDPKYYGGDRSTVAIIGFLATWWVGCIIGLFIGLFCLMYKTPKTMTRGIIRGTMITFSITAIMGLAGYMYGKHYVQKAPVNWWLPNQLTDTNNFIVVGTIHNFSYLGGVSGMVIAIIYLLFKKRSTTPIDYEH